NLIAGLAMYLSGPLILRLIFRAFVVVVGFLMLSGAVNTAIIGSNGVLNRISEDGVLTDWFRQPHPRFGTSYRIINLVVFLQLFTIIASRGNVYWLGEAYAFGVIWSFTFNSLAMLVLRFKYKGERGWKVPPNLRIAGHEIPLGHLKWVLERADTDEQDIVVMSARVSQFGTAAYDLSTEQIFSDYEQQLFTRAVSVAESFGKHVSLLVVPARDVWSAIVQTAI